MAEKLKINEVYHLSKDVSLHTEKDGAEFCVSIGSPLNYLGKQKRGNFIFSIFHIQNGFMNIYLPQEKVSDYIHDAVTEAVRKAR